MNTPLPITTTVSSSRGQTKTAVGISSHRSPMPTRPPVPQPLRRVEEQWSRWEQNQPSWLTRDTDDGGCVYLVGFANEEEDVRPAGITKRRIKIGYTSTSIEHRLGQMLTSTPDDLCLVESTIWFPLAKWYEKYLHARLKTHRIKREWFSVTDEELEHIEEYLDADSEYLGHGWCFWSNEKSVCAQSRKWGMLDPQVPEHRDEIVRRYNDLTELANVPLFSDSPWTCRPRSTRRS